MILIQENTTLKVKTLVHMSSIYKYSTVSSKMYSILNSVTPYTAKTRNSASYFMSLSEVLALIKTGNLFSVYWARHPVHAGKGLSRISSGENGWMDGGMCVQPEFCGVGV